MIGSHEPSGRNWPTSFIVQPAGVCIQLLTTRIQDADVKVPNAIPDRRASKCRERLTAMAAMP